jgi:hypothetical protein
MRRRELTGFAKTYPLAQTGMAALREELQPPRN